MRKLYSIAFFVLFSTQAIAETYRAEFIGAYDADTYRLKINIWIDQYWESNVRLSGVDTPEKSWRASCFAEREMAERARVFALEHLSNADQILVTIKKAGKFGRPLAVVSVDGLDMAAALVNAGFAKPYDGGAKDPWCD